MPLSFVKAGRRVRIFVVDASHGLQGRLAAMGILPGEEIEVLLNSVRGHGMAQKIQVE